MPIRSPVAALAPGTLVGLHTQALDRLRALPGVRAGCPTSSLPLIPAGSDRASLSPVALHGGTTSAVDPAYFETMGIERIAGTIVRREHSYPGHGRSHREPCAPTWPDRSAVGECASLIRRENRSRLSSLASSATPRFVRSANRHSRISIAASLHVTRARSWPEFLNMTTDPARLTETVRARCSTSRRVFACTRCSRSVCTSRFVRSASMDYKHFDWVWHPGVAPLRPACTRHCLSRQPPHARNRSTDGIGGHSTERLSRCRR